jgi:hypothetical protein
MPLWFWLVVLAASIVLVILVLRNESMVTRPIALLVAFYLAFAAFIWLGYVQRPWRPASTPQ